MASSPGVESISRNYFLCPSISSNSSSVEALSWDCSSSITPSGSTSNSSSLAVSTTPAVTSATEVLNPSNLPMRIGINFFQTPVNTVKWGVPAFAICVPSLVRCLIRSLAHFLIILFPYCWMLWVLCIFGGTSPLLDITFASIFSQSGTCLLNFLSVFFYGYMCTSHSGVCHMTDSMKSYKLKNHQVLSPFLSQRLQGIVIRTIVYMQLGVKMGATRCSVSSCSNLNPDYATAV